MNPLTRVTVGSRRFGKKRVPNCRCEYNFTCKFCLEDAVTQNIADSNTLPGVPNPHFQGKYKSFGKENLDLDYHQKEYDNLVDFMNEGR